MRRIFWLLGLALSLPGTTHAQAGKYRSVEALGGPSVMRNGATAPSFSLYGGWQRQAASFLSLFSLVSAFQPPLLWASELPHT